MRNKLAIGNWKKKSSVFLALAMVASLSIQPVSVRAAAAKSVAAKAITFSVEDDTQVLVVGNSYDLEYALSPSKSTEKVTFKSSNPAIATVSKKGVITAKKQGVVNVVATTESGKKVSKKIWVVAKDCVTAYQATVDKMLVSNNIKKVAIRNTKSAQKYLIKKGDYTSKTLYVNAPKSDVKNFGKFKQINIVDIAENTWLEEAVGNSFKITDNNAHFVVSETAQVNSVTVASDNAKVAIEADGNVGTVNVTGAKSAVSVEAGKEAVVKELHVTSTDAKVTVVADGSVEKIVLDSKADLEITGSSAGIAVEVTKKAEGASVQSAVPVTASVAAKATFVLEKGAEASELSKTGSAVEVAVDNKTTAKVVVTNEETKKTEEVPSGTTNAVTPAPGTTTGGTGTTTPTTPTEATATVTGAASNGGKTATYTLPVAITSLKTATVKVKTASVTKDYAINGLVLTYVTNLLSNSSSYLTKWSNSAPISVTVGGLSVSATTIDADTKLVTFDGKEFEVTVSGSSVVVNKKNSAVTYTLTKSSDGTTLTITSNTNTNVAGLVSFVVTY